MERCNDLPRVLQIRVLHHPVVALPRPIDTPGLPQESGRCGTSKSDEFVGDLASFLRGNCSIFDLTAATETPSCACCLNTGSSPYARKPRLCYLDGLLSRRSHRSVGL